MAKLTCKQRRINARKDGVAFEPQYNTIIRYGENGKQSVVGGAPIPYEEAYFVGYERFDNKFVKVSALTKE